MLRSDYGVPILPHGQRLQQDHQLMVAGALRQGSYCLAAVFTLLHWLRPLAIHTLLQRTRSHVSGAALQSSLLSMHSPSEHCLESDQMWQTWSAQLKGRAAENPSLHHLTCTAAPLLQPP